MSALLPISPSLSSSPPPSSHPEKLFFDSATSVRLLSLSAAQRNLGSVASAHAGLLKSGLHSNLFVANSLLDAYSKCGRLDSAVKIFDRMPLRDVISWTTMISGQCHNGAAIAAVLLFIDMLLAEATPPPNEFTAAAVLRACGMLGDEKTGRMFHGHLVVTGFAQDAFVSNSLVDTYAKVGSIPDAENLLGSLSCKDVVSWSSIISGSVLNGALEKALLLFVEMLEEGTLPNTATMLSVIQACSLRGEPSLFPCVHAWLVKLELHDIVPIAKSLTVMYAKNGSFEEGMKVFFNILVPNESDRLDPDVISALIHGCTRSGSLEHGKVIHGFLFKTGFFPCTIVENSLVDLYAKYEHIESAYLIFERMEERDIVSWNTMISCYVKNDRADEALQLLGQVHTASGGKLAPDFVTMLSSIQACSMMSSLEQGQILHGFVIKSGFDLDVSIGNSLIDMYGKAGRARFAEQIFQEMDSRDIGSWNSMIATYGINGDGDSALRAFDELRYAHKHKPNAVTFINVISACNHSGMTLEGYECFKCMKRNYDIEPNMEHYAAIVDLLGRSGKLSEAEEFIAKMPIKPGSSVWGSLLGACVLHQNVKIAKRAAEELSVMEPDSNAWRATLSNVYASAGLWDEAAKVRAEMKRKGLGKEAGWSYVESRGMDKFKFTVGDTRHPETDRIYHVWRSIREHSADAFVETL
ncbi:pentatricopeptide repeat-containing protein [Canna indica]|uniref:Pentatricopeptide repeat-containing protein n=1 Tax=Canna indica TaxID=4628 RepID=A0AAQ3Q7V1_9LILI|nr:pentatricopeptide repeat-containing protein [Canna indica]